MSLRASTPLLKSATRTRIRLSSTVTSSYPKLDQWIEQTQRNASFEKDDHISLRHLANLHITLPTRDGTVTPYAPPDRLGEALPYGHHLVFFHPHSPERDLRSDGTDATFCPPEPFTRRMWAGGVMRFNNRRPLLTGEDAVAITAVERVEKKGFNEGTPMVFVTQRIDYKRRSLERTSAKAEEGSSVQEERTHVYLPISPEIKRGMRQVKNLPQPQFSSTSFFSPTTLFRFSALTWNGHHIHLDREYAQGSEGYAERLVHGPLTALMLLETAGLHNPGLRIREFSYRAINPVVVDRKVAFHGAWKEVDGEPSMDLWATLEDGTVGMMGKITVDP